MCGSRPPHAGARGSGLPPSTLGVPMNRTASLAVTLAPVAMAASLLVAPARARRRPHVSRQHRDRVRSTTTSIVPRGATCTLNGHPGRRQRRGQVRRDVDRPRVGSGVSRPRPRPGVVNPRAVVGGAAVPCRGDSERQSRIGGSRAARARRRRRRTSRVRPPNRRLVRRPVDVTARDGLLQLVPARRALGAATAVNSTPARLRGSPSRTTARTREEPECPARPCCGSSTVVSR